MATIRDIQELSRYIRESGNSLLTGYALAMLKMAAEAESRAKRKVTQNFIGREGYRLSGRLLNSVFSRTTPFTPGESLPEVEVGTRGIPYGAIHEFGGEITPKNANHLWVKQRLDARFRRLTPREFMQRKNSNSQQYKFIRSKKKNLVAVFQERADSEKFVPLFVLRDKVTIPARPFIRPSIDEAMESMPDILSDSIRKELKRTP